MFIFFVILVVLSGNKIGFVLEGVCFYFSNYVVWDF